MIGADIDLLRWELRLPAILECARLPGTHLLLAGKRDPSLAFSVVNYCGKRNLRGRVSFFPYYDVCRDFPVLKKQCDAWLDDESLLTGERLVPTSLPNFKKALFATMFNPMKNEGNAVVMRQWLRLLRQEGDEVHLLYYGLDMDDPRNKSAEPVSALCDKSVIVPVKSVLVGRNGNGLNTHVDDWCGPEVITALQGMVNETSYDLCFSNCAFFRLFSTSVLPIPKKFKHVYEKLTS